jgi:thymidylate kinase
MVAPAVPRGESADGSGGSPQPGAWVQTSRLTTRPSAELVDRAAVDRVLVHGSPPGEGRDLDLLIRPGSDAAVRSALLAAGFHASDHRLVRFRQGTCEQVELYPAASWGLPADELAAVFDEAVPLPGFDRLVRPSPVHTLLILGRRVVEGVGHLDEKRRRYVEWAVRHDPKVWDHAVDRAEAWHGMRSLELLERLVGYGFVPLPVRARIIDARLRASGRSPLRAHLETGRQLAPRRRLPVVVAISGLDGSGKSTQARLLVEAFNRIGIDCAVEWAKLGEDRRLWAVRRWGRRVLGGSALRSSAQEAQTQVDPGSHASGSPADDGPTGLRSSGTALSTPWASIVLASNIWTFRRQVLRYGGRAQFLVYDRYVLDSAVHLRWRYGLGTRDAAVLTRALVRWSPTPIRAFYLEMPPSIAQRRKMEDKLEDLGQHADLYGEALRGPSGSGVTVLDGTQPIETLAATIAESVWNALEERESTRTKRLRRLVRLA